MELATIEEEMFLFMQTLGAMLIGGIVGFERELANRPAGFRTHMLVAGASSLLVRLGEPLLALYQKGGLGDVVEADPFRTIGAVVTGIAFLGAGTIIQRQSKLKVEGLTTAASLLFSGTIGMAAAVDYWFLAAGLAISSVMILQILGRFDDWIEKKRDGE